MRKELNNETYLDNCDTVPVVRFKAFDDLKWLNCGFSTRTGGVSTGPLESLNLGFERGDMRENVAENFRRFAESAGFDISRICLPRQWHTNNIRVSKDADRVGDIATYSVKPLSEEEKLRTAIDGQITGETGLVLIAYGADCTPVYLADTGNRKVGLVHSGWKGTLNSISSDALRLMNELYGTSPVDVIAVIGPSISSENYEVGYDVAQHFINKHHIEVKESSGIVRLGQCIKSQNDDCVIQKYQLDLWEANRQNLLDCGVPDENIHISGLCTFREEELFYSHRRTGNARGVMAGFIEIV